MQSTYYSYSSYNWKERKNKHSQPKPWFRIWITACPCSSCNMPQHSPCQECNDTVSVGLKSHGPPQHPTVFSSSLVICLQDKLLAIQVLLELLYSPDYRQAFFLDSGVSCWHLEIVRLAYRTGNFFPSHSCNSTSRPCPDASVQRVNVLDDISGSFRIGCEASLSFTVDSALSALTSQCISRQLLLLTSRCTNGQLLPLTSRCTNGQLLPLTSRCTNGQLLPLTSWCTNGQLLPLTSQCTNGQLLPLTSWCISGQLLPLTNNTFLVLPLGLALWQLSQDTKNRFILASAPGQYKLLIILSAVLPFPGWPDMRTSWPAAITLSLNVDGTTNCDVTVLSGSL